MKAFLLAAGLATRLRPLTDTTPKCLLPIRGRPLMGIWLDLFSRHGIDEVLVNTHGLGETVRSYLATHGNGLITQVVDEPVLLGSAGTLLANREWAASESCFWVIYADVLTTANLTRIMQFHLKHQGVATLGACEVADPRRCGVLDFNQEGLIERFVEKPTSPTSNMAFAGIMVANARLFDAIPERFPADLGFDVLPQLAGKMFAYPITEYLLDVGTLENYEKAQRSWPGIP